MAELVVSWQTKVWWITGIAVLLIVVLFVGLKMIDNIYKKIVRFLIKTHIARIDFESESEVDEFNDWLYSIKSQKRKPSMKKKAIKIFGNDILVDTK